MDRIALTALAALSLVVENAGAAEFRVKPAEATLSDSERTYPRVGIEPTWRPTHAAGNHRYRVEVNTVIEIAGPDQSKHRRVSVPADCRLRWLGAAEGVAFLIADRDPTKLDPKDPESGRRFQHAVV